MLEHIPLDTCRFSWYRVRPKFEVDEKVTGIYNLLCMEYEIDKEDYVPGIYEYKLKNVS